MPLVFDAKADAQPEQKKSKDKVLELVWQLDLLRLLDVSLTTLQPSPPSTASICPVMKLGPAGEEDHSLGNVLRCSVAPHWSFQRKALGGSFALSSPIFDPSGSNAIDSNVRSKSLGHCLCQHVQRGLRGTVVGVTGPGAHSPERADIDDPAAGGAEMRQRFASDEKRSAGVGLEDCIPLGSR